MEGHKHSNSKSGMARSLLHRVSSKQSIGDGESPGASSPVSNSNSPSPALNLPARQTQAPQHGSPSIEQSVRMFRLYEALRSGDTAAISKAIKETTPTNADGISRPSTTSIAYSSNAPGALDGTTILHLAVQCAELPVVEFVITSAVPRMNVNGRDKDGNTPLHIASMLNRASVVKLFLDQKDINDSITNYQGRTPLDLAMNPDVFQHLQLARSIYIDARIQELQRLVTATDYDKLEDLLVDEHFQSAVDVNGGELATDPTTVEGGGTLLHEAARKKDVKLVQILLLNGADPFRRDRNGKLPQDVTKDDKTRAMLKKSPAAAAAQRGVQEKTILGGNPQAAISNTTGEHSLGGKEGREMKGFLKKWTNYTTGYKLRWFVLEDGVLSYYKHQDDAGSACRGAINMKIATLHMDAQDKLRFEIIGKSSVKYHLKANHQVEAKRWFWALNNAVQWSKDEAKEDSKKQNRNNEMLRQAKLGQGENLRPTDDDSASISSFKVASNRLSTGTAGNLSRTGTRDAWDEDNGATDTGNGDHMRRISNFNDSTTVDGDMTDDEEYGDDASEVEVPIVHKDAFLIAAQSARLQLDLLAQISNALQGEKSKNPHTPISEPAVAQVLASYETAAANLRGLVGDLGRIARDRESYWQYKLEQEINVRRMWEASMTRVAKEQEELETRIGESEDKRKRTKRALRDALEGQMTTADTGRPRVQIEEPAGYDADEETAIRDALPTQRRKSYGGRRRSTIAEIANISDSDSDNDEEFFDAVDAGEIEVIEEMPTPVASPPVAPEVEIEPVRSIRASKESDLKLSYKGYEDPPRARLKMDADDRPKISLWSILKSMIGKDMTKMTLPVSFNEPTSLLQRVAEDMEYTELLDNAADRIDSTERMVYVAAFAASEYASTIGRVAKPFNPLLGETYEYVRPDKGYRFLIEQVSHHPPIGAAWAESAKWDYYGESAVRSKFYGRSFDINPLGTWFLKLRPASTSSTGTPFEELYTWKKVTSSVIGIITGSPTVDNYGVMEIKNHTTGETCTMDFKPRGWKASSAFQVTGKVQDRSGNTRWSIGGRWNDKIYARLTPGYQGSVEPPHASGKKAAEGDQAFLVWESHARPTGIPFNLTPFVVTLNALPDSLRRVLAPTDTRLRPDQRAMEDGQYEFAATEKNRVEEKQRAKRREREGKGEEFVPRWFRKGVCAVTGEEFWEARTGGKGDGEGVEYWRCREKGAWEGCEDIF